MPLIIAVGGVSQVGDGLWTTTLTPAEVRRLGTASSLGARSVIGLFGPDFDAASAQLVLDPSSIVVLAVGDSEETLLIDLKKSVAGNPGLGDQTHTAAADVPKGGGKGDEAFLRASLALLSNDLVSSIQCLLEQVRQRHPGELREGQARKWVNSPDNFLAITIQPRDRSFAIHARGEPGDYGALSSIDVKRDRPGYVRFKLQKASQLEDALNVVLRSARRS